MTVDASDATDPPTARNRLDDEQSPYLQQHADNPVNWQPWDDAALDAAAEQDKPIFLSVGYSACHWCHVMEEESFEDETIATLLNEHFVPIKVDREERPDVDRIYQTIAQLTSGRGGWPLSAWLTPDGRPFYVGTYFPRDPKRGMPGFADLLERLRDTWENDRSGIEERADEWTRAIRGQLEETPDEPGDAPDETVLETAADAAVRAADREHGGFGTDGPKFPQAGRVHLLLRAAERTGTEAYREVALEALDAMANGGIFDHVGGGFHRYATDREWTVPHFEKMLYDNAEIPRALLAGYQVTGEDRYATVVAETIDFLTRELQHPDGGFYSTLDARSGGEEGTFYVWTPEQVHAVVDNETDAELFCERYGVTEHGNFEHGTTVLTVSASVADLAADHNVAPDEVEAALERARQQVFDARTERTRPARDEKVLAGWNGLAISMLAEAGIVLDDAYADVATDALGFVREHLFEAETGRLSRRFKDGEVAIDGYLEDYAFLARGAFDVYQATGDVDHLAFALELARGIERDFWDADERTLYFTPESGEALVSRPQELTDQSTPSSAGVAADVLATLSQFVTHDRFLDVAEGVLETHGNRIRGNPLQHASLLLAVDQYASGAPELTVAAESLPATWRERIGTTYLPARVLALRPPADLEAWLTKLDLDAAPPIWADRDQRDGEPTIYACRNFACSPPEHDVDAALAWLADGS
jgi:hypothetical protein